MAEHVVRFVVGSQDGFRGSTWRCWIPGRAKNDIYLAPRSIAGSYKISLHQSGDWRLALTEQFEKKLRSEGRWNDGIGRLLAQWPRSRTIGPDTVLAFRIVVPHSAVTIPSDPAVLPREMVWIDPPTPGRSVEVSLLIIERELPQHKWPGQSAMKTQFVGRMPLPNGHTVCIVSREAEVPSSSPSPGVAAEGFLSNLKTEVRSEVEERLDEYRFLLPIFGNDGRPEALMEYKHEKHPKVRKS
jgi:hypothetical protein